MVTEYYSQTFRFGVGLLAPADVLMQEAARVGQESGRDRDWEPDTLLEAVIELVIYNQDLIVPLSKSDHGPGTFFFDLKIAIFDRKELQKCYDGVWMTDRKKETLLLGGLMSDAGPIDQGFEIIDIPLETSAHEQTQVLHAAYESYLHHGAPKVLC